jgi:hypothetical protein
MKSLKQAESMAVIHESITKYHSNIFDISTNKRKVMLEKIKSNEFIKPKLHDFENPFMHIDQKYENYFYSIEIYLKI